MHLVNSLANEVSRSFLHGMSFVMTLAVYVSVSCEFVDKIFVLFNRSVSVPWCF